MPETVSHWHPEDVSRLWKTAYKSNSKIKWLLFYRGRNDTQTNSLLVKYGNEQQKQKKKRNIAMDLLGNDPPRHLSQSQGRF